MALRTRTLDGIDQVAAADWDALGDADDPFTRHAYLLALEATGSAHPERGWVPAHLAAFDGDTLVGAVPRYLKQDSWGEFVFDFAWAEAAESIGLPWYPKAVAAVPFTPVAGPRLLSRDEAARTALATALATSTDEAGLSSTHVLFCGDRDSRALQAAGGLVRHGLRLEWRDRGCGDFDGYLDTLRSRRRKEVRRERRRVAECGVAFRCVNGTEVSPETWPLIHALYASTYARRGQKPGCRYGSWPAVAAAPGAPLRVVLGERGAELVCCALYLVGRDTVYGRHWGSREDGAGLHFEACYYQGIELCLREGCSRYDAGVQGWQKLHRGFEPVIQSSVHFITDARLRAAIAPWLATERRHVAGQCLAAQQHTAGPRA